MAEEKRERRPTYNVSLIVWCGCVGGYVRHSKIAPCPGMVGVISPLGTHIDNRTGRIDSADWTIHGAKPAFLGNRSKWGH
jgi:hypothetical protein